MWGGVKGDEVAGCVGRQLCGDTAVVAHKAWGCDDCDENVIALATTCTAISDELESLNLLIAPELRVITVPWLAHILCV